MCIRDRALADATAIKKSLAKILPEYEVGSVHETPVPGLFEVLVGSDVLYVSKDGRYMAVSYTHLDVYKRQLNS